MGSFGRKLRRGLSNKAIAAPVANSGHSDDCPSLSGGECVFPCYMQPVPTDRAELRAHLAGLSDKQIMRLAAKELAEPKRAGKVRRV